MNDKRDRDTGDGEFEARAKALFDDSVAALDGETQSRLNRGRQAALSEIRGRRSLWPTLVPVTGVAAAAVVAVLVIGRAPEMEALDAPVTDIEILLDEDSLEMLEDLEFYSWMELADADSTEGPQNNVG